MNDRYSIEVYRSWSAVEARWLALELDGDLTPFQSSHWLRSWYSSQQSPAVAPIIVVVSDRTTGADVLMLPLIASNDRAIRTISFAGGWLCDTNAPLICRRQVFDPAAARQIWASLRRALPAADSIRLDKMPADINGVANPFMSLPGLRRSQYTGHIAVLPDDFKTYTSNLPVEPQKIMARRWKKFAKLPDANLHVFTADDALAGFRDLHRLQTARLDRLGIVHVLATSQSLSFYEHLVEAGVRNGAVTLTALRIGTSVVAGFLAIRQGQRLVYVRSGFDESEQWKSFGLGKCIIYKSVELAHAAGCRMFDMSIGDNAYKDHFNAVPAPYFELDRMLTWRAVPSAARTAAQRALRATPALASAAKSLSNRLRSHAPVRPTPAL